MFGYACYPWLRPQTQNKFSPRSKECEFIGYSLNHKRYRCLNPSTYIFCISRDVTFDKTSFLFSIIAYKQPAPTTPSNVNQSYLFPFHSSFKPDISPTMNSSPITSNTHSNISTSTPMIFDPLQDSVPNPLNPSF